MSRIAISSLALASLLAAAAPGFGKAPPKTSAHKPGNPHQPMGAVSSQMPQCPGPADGPNPAYIIKVFLNDGWEAGGTRKIVFNPPGGVAEDDTNDTGTSDLPPGTPEINPFHIHLQQVRTVAKTSNLTDYWIKVRIVLKSSKFTFGDAPLPDGTLLHSLANGGAQQEPSAPVYKCEAHPDQPLAPPDPNHPDHQTAIFFIHVSATTTTDVSQGYNIILMPKLPTTGAVNLPPDTPVIIDPKIINNG